MRKFLRFIWLIFCLVIREILKWRIKRFAANDIRHTQYDRRIIPDDIRHTNRAGGQIR